MVSPRTPSKGIAGKRHPGQRRKGMTGEAGTTPNGPMRARRPNARPR